MLQSTSQDPVRRRSVIKESDCEIQTLRAQVEQMSVKLAHLEAPKPITKHCVVPSVFSLGKDGRPDVNSFGRNVSVNTAHVLRSIPKVLPDRVAQRVEEAFVQPMSALQYFYSTEFGTDLIALSEKVLGIFRTENRCVTMESPVHIIGDIHGNLDDLKFFSQQFWKLGMHLTAGNFLFLGDYVDRGLSSLECVAYLFSMKIKNPKKMIMIRGNHEIRAVNGCESHYGLACLLGQCKKRFGEDQGLRIWSKINDAFDSMPLAAVVDNDIFCVHGGLPRPIADQSELDSIQDIPVLCTFEEDERKLPLCDQLLLRVAKDLLWADPASESSELSLSKSGFGPSSRGGDSICYGYRAIESFLQRHSFSYIVRAHEACHEGVELKKSAQVLTVFSTSKHHGLGKRAKCGCILVDNNRIHIINRSCTYNEPKEEEFHGDSTDEEGDQVLEYDNNQQDE